MRIWSAVLGLFFIGCGSPNEKVNSIENKSEPKIIDADFPLFLDAIDFGNPKKTVAVSDGINAEISKTVRDFYNSEGDSEMHEMFPIEKSHLATIRLSDKKQTLYVLMLKGFPVSELICKILVYDNDSEQFLGNPIDFKIYALYDDLKNGKLQPSNLKTQFGIKTPEIQKIDLEGDGVYEFKFARLFHNGTCNAIDTQILKVENGELRLSQSLQSGLGKYSAQ
ncbi:hypothetical protein [Flavobacterium sp.]|uniref:hypothetical protein n=1 Tax=Flavobacterium sp. TaxID=239 RepID=UPI0012214A17|nr:hypothetical protein [Flavobacterium sp.]RZJ69261.1 MAG: hypothetical protein EOO49_18035 [Flavobacterium sp.]